MILRELEIRGVEITKPLVGEGSHFQCVYDHNGVTESLHKITISNREQHCARSAGTPPASTRGTYKLLTLMQSLLGENDVRLECSGQMMNT